MEALAAVVFERTPQGAVVIKSTGDEVPRRLRTLLLAVDGRSPVSQYVPFLTAFAPLSEKFEELEQMGYLRRKAGLTGQAGRQPAAPLPDVAPTGFMPLSYEAGLNDIARGMSQPAGQNAAAPLDAFERELQALARQMGRALPESEAQGAAPAAPPSGGSFVAMAVSVRQPTLQDLLREMDSFLSRAAGLEGLPVALMLAQITSVAQLRREMPAYRQLIQSYGIDAQAHGEQLASMLDQTGL